ncbi:hypothetical protein, partial [Pseudonocardia xishanensis]|uniref:hypothetical protein n=1 Tax=Pseudonocardia xishanensis TaxID=630995 RepID=UPI0031EB014C
RTAAFESPILEIRNDRWNPPGLPGSSRRTCPLGTFTNSLSEEVVEPVDISHAVVLLASASSVS